MNHACDYDFHWLEQRLLPLGFQIVFLNRTPESFAAAREEHLRVSGNPGQYADLNRFIEEQKLFQCLISESSLPKLEVDISDNDIARAVEKIADWMEQIIFGLGTGGDLLLIRCMIRKAAVPSMYSGIYAVKFDLSVFGHLLEELSGYQRVKKRRVFSFVPDYN